MKILENKYPAHVFFHSAHAIIERMVRTMKESEKKKPVKTIPDGVWESSRPVKTKKDKNDEPFTPSTDLQGNGYPFKNISRQGK